MGMVYGTSNEMDLKRILVIIQAPVAPPSEDAETLNPKSGTVPSFGSSEIKAKGPHEGNSEPSRQVLCV